MCKHHRHIIAVKMDFAQQGILPARYAEQQRFIDLRLGILVPAWLDCKFGTDGLQTLGQGAVVDQPMPVDAAIDGLFNPGRMGQ